MDCSCYKNERKIVLLFMLCVGICMFAAEVYGKASFSTELRQSLATVIQYLSYSTADDTLINCACCIIVNSR